MADSCLGVTAGTHWSKDTLGLLQNLARCVLTPLHGRRRDLRVNFPLSSNSVFREKNCR
jgi:hypothetical protein